MLVETTSRHSMFFLLGGFSGWNQIKMDHLDAKTLLWIPMGNFHYTVVSFGLKMVVPISTSHDANFPDMLHDCVKDYVNDIVVKPKEVLNHVSDMRKVIVKCMQYKLRMSHLKCAFGVFSKKLLGFTVHGK